MDAAIFRQLDVVESTLNSLIDSVASYNPSVGVATALLAADNGLHQGLKDLAVHQKHHAQILQLRKTIAEQNEEISSTLNLLADTRTDLLSTPMTLPPQDARSIPYNDLLDYARRISRFTLPSNYRPANMSIGKHEIQESEASDQPQNPAGAQQGIGLESLQQEEKQWLEPFTGTQFTPWPSEDVIKRGALGKIQGMLEKNINPEEVARDGIEESIGFEERKEEDQAQATPAAATTTAGGMKMQRREEKPKVFGGLELYNPEAPDEDG